MTELTMWMKPGSAYFESVLDGDDGSLFSFDQVALPDGWSRDRDVSGPWTRVNTPNPQMPDSGWKMHVSARIERADAVLSAIAPVLVDRGIAFKYLRGPQTFRTLNAKYAPRASAGKFIAIFPRDAAEFDELAVELGAILRDEEGPAILTDLPLLNGPLHARYGGFRRRRAVRADGGDVFLMRTPSGDMPDTRELVFRAPQGVIPPRSVADALDRRRRTREARTLPYRIATAMHFSNGGGVYDAVSDDGTRVAVKEGRRHTGFGIDGSDAEQRLRREYDVLRELAEIDGVPETLAWHSFEDRAFLVESFVEGGRAIEFVARCHPGTRRGTDAESRRRYIERVDGLIAQVERTLLAMHDRGWTFGDLHPGNLLIGADDTVTLIDFETARRHEEPAVDFTVPPGFSTPGLEGAPADLRRLELLRLWFLAPENAYWDFSPVILRRTAALAAREFEIDAERFDRLGADTDAPRSGSHITPCSETADVDRVVARASARIVDKALRGSALSLPAGPGAESWTLGSGAGGALLVASESVDVSCALADAYVTAVEQSDRMLPGLFTGFAGAAVVLHRLNRAQEAHSALERAAHLSAGLTNLDVERGLFGVVVAGLRLGRLDVAETVARRAHALMPSAGSGVGLLKGPSGAALGCVRLFEATSDERWLDRAEELIDLDVLRLHDREDGVILLDHGNRKLLPSLGHGSLGVAYAAGELARHRPADRWDRLREAAGRTCLAGAWATQGLFDGRAGAVAFLASVGPRNDEERGLLAVNTRTLLGRFVEIDGEIHFPGISGLRFSDDLEAGMAGALHALRLTTTPGSTVAVPGLAMSRIDRKDTPHD